MENFNIKEYTRALDPSSIKQQAIQAVLHMTDKECIEVLEALNVRKKKQNESTQDNSSYSYGVGGVLNQP